MEVGVEAVEGVVSFPSPALQILPPMSKTRGEVRKSTNAKESGREELRDLTKSN
jgi:hypothetical protein